MRSDSPVISILQVREMTLSPPRLAYAAGGGRTRDFISGSLGRNICVGDSVGKLFPIVVRGAYKGNSCSFHLSGFREGCEECLDRVADMACPLCKPQKELWLC